MYEGFAKTAEAEGFPELAAKFRMVGVLVVGGLQEQCGDLLKALLLGLGREIGILVPGLG